MTKLSDDVQGAMEVGPDLDKEFRRMGLLLAQYGDLEADAHELALTAKADYEQARAGAYKRFKDQSTDKKPTEAAVDAAIELDPEVKRYRVKAITAEANARRMKSYFVSLLAKKDMLVQLGSAAREAMKADPTMRRG